jgi:ribose transport system substrate-binding protein
MQSNISSGGPLRAMSRKDHTVIAPKLKPEKTYLVPAVTKVFDILELLGREKGSLSLEQIYQKVRAPKTTIYRLLKTCVHRGYVAQGSDGLYRLSSQPRKMRFGFAAQSSDMPFSEIVTSSLKAAAMRNGVELLVLDNHYDPEIAVRNAERLVQEQVDLVIEFQIEHSVAAIISDKIAVAGIPLVAVDMPHPHATYFGADNYRLGYSAGEALARYAIKHWKSKVRWVLGLDLEQAGAFVQNRTTGAFNGIRSLLPDLEIESFVRMDSRGLRDKGYKLVLEFLARHPKDKGILIAAHNDTVALGAVQAVRELHMEQSVAIAGQDGIAEAVEEMMKPSSPLVVSTEHFAESYGERLVALGLNILRGHAVPPYNFTEQKILTQESLRAGATKGDVRLLRESNI